MTSLEFVAADAKTRQDVTHLLRRAAFGGSAADVQRYAAGGYAATVVAVSDHTIVDEAAEAEPAPTFDVAGYLEAQRSDDVERRRQAVRQLRADRIVLVTWWLQRMVVADAPWREKLTLLWHDHFATSIAKVKLAALLHNQRATLYSLGAGRFDELTRAVARDPAMLIWLDGNRNRVGRPNENFARELFELFTLGHGAAGHDPSLTATSDNGDHTGQPYSEGDISEAARACTGWQPDVLTSTSRLVPRRHDDGVKNVLGASGRLGIDDVVDVAIAHPACAPHVVSRLVSRLGWPATPADPVVVELAGGFTEDLDVAGLLRRLFEHPRFLDAETRTAVVRTPVEYVVGTLRALGLPFARRHLEALRNLGQVPFLPPDVSGWPANAAWLSTSAALARLHFAEDVAAAADLVPIADTAPSERGDAVANLLGVDHWSSASTAALAATGGDPAAMVTVALVAPEYVVA